jgi:hypothetical protein
VGAWRIERLLASIHRLMTHLVGFEDACCAFEPKDLLDAFPIFAKPVVEIRTTADVTMLEPPMRFVPRLLVCPAATVWCTILKQIGTILFEGGLIVLGNQDIVSTSRCTRAQNARCVCIASKVKMRPVTRCGVNNGLSATLLMLFFLHITTPQDDASGHLITTELMHRMRLRTGGRDQFCHQ